MTSIDHLRILVGLGGEDELRIAHCRPELEREMMAWAPEYEAWFREITAWREGNGAPFLEGYLASFVSGCYDEDFYAVQYHQALLWLRHRIDGGHGIAALSRLRQFFIGLSESWQQHQLARSLCRVVDVSQSVHATVSHLSHTLERLRKGAEQDVQRIRHGCETVASLEDGSVVQAYTDHFRWKVRAYSLALGDGVEPHEVPLDHHECALGRWLDEGGLERVPEASRQGLQAAHERLHNLMATALGEARRQRPQYIVEYLLDVEAASEEIAAVLGLCIEAEMRRIAILDGLTGLGNRRLFQQELARREAHARRNRAGFGLLFMDLDYFKSVNDRYGHRGGDQVLRAVAARLREEVRGADAVYRWGGEEFTALVHASGPAELARSAERLRIAVASMPVGDGAVPEAVTLSVGGAWFDPAEDLDPGSLFARSDRNLNRAKHEGRNRVVVT
jgi:diguanylate cyclase (GGDEF)-like protein